MKRRDNEQVATRRLDWLALERSGRDAEAEQALLALFGELERFTPPSPAFVDRVLWRARRPLEPSWATHWGVRAAAMVCLVQTALLAGAGLVGATMLGARLSLDTLVLTATGFGVTLLRLGSELGESLSAAGRTIRTVNVALGPQALSLAVICTLVSATALWALIRTTGADERWLDGIDSGQ